MNDFLFFSPMETFESNKKTFTNKNLHPKIPFSSCIFLKMRFDQILQVEVLLRGLLLLLQVLLLF